MLGGAPTARPPSVRIPVMVSRMACGDEVEGWTGGALRIRVVATRAEGRDDKAVESLLAEVLGVEARQVRVIVGRGARHKWVEIEDYDENDLERQLPGR